MEQLKSITDLDKPDPRSAGFAVWDGSGFRDKELIDHYKLVEEITLLDRVPELIRDHFQTARNLLVYAWFVYRFIPVAELHASSSLELALKLKLEEKRGGLGRLIRRAIDEGLVRNEGFSAFRQRLENKERERERLIALSEALGRRMLFSEDLPDYLAHVAKSVPFVRNVYAHGSNSIAPGGYLKLSICADFINQLYEDRAEG